MFCPKCGNQNPDGAAFCGACGAQFAASTPAATSAATSSTSSASASTSMPLGGQLATDGSMAAAAHNTGRKLGILIAGAAVVVIAAILLFVFVFSSKPVYATIGSVTYSTIDGTELISSSYTRADDGAITSVTTTYKGLSDTTDYKNLGDGVTVAEDATAEYETNANGDVIRIQYTNQTVDITYYRPGIIKSRTTTFDSGSTRSNTIVYDEDGWQISSERVTDSDTTTTNYDHKLSSDGKSAMVYSSGGSDAVRECALDEHGKVTEIYYVVDGDKELASKYTYQKIDKPARYVAAISRLKPL